MKKMKFLTLLLLVSVISSNINAGDSNGVLLISNEENIQAENQSINVCPVCGSDDIRLYGYIDLNNPEHFIVEKIKCNTCGEETIISEEEDIDK